MHAITHQLARLHVNELFLLNSHGAVLREIRLPDISIPFFAPVHYRCLPDGNENRILLIPLASSNADPSRWTPGVYRFRYKLRAKLLLQKEGPKYQYGE